MPLIHGASSSSPADGQMAVGKLEENFQIHDFRTYSCTAGFIVLRCCTAPVFEAPVPIIAVAYYHGPVAKIVLEVVRACEYPDLAPLRRRFACCREAVNCLAPFPPAATGRQQRTESNSLPFLA
jgi:hypothetical protein